MSKRILILLLFLPNLLLATEDPLTIQLEGLQSRHRLSTPEVGPFTVELCQLQPGEDYQLWLSQQAQKGGQVKFLDNGTAATTYSFTASADCQSIPLVQTDSTASKTKYILSVSCETCERETDNSRMANLTVSPGLDALTLIQDIFIGGNCFDVSNVSVIGSAAGAGQFGMGDASIGIGSGVIISSGNVTNAPGPNNSGSTGNNLGGGGHPDLADLAGTTDINDATGIEFQFTPTIDNITFRYVFASEEYCEFVDAGFNDVFGFFISGPGINGGFTGNGDNIAVLPGSNIGVTIDNINDQDNTVFFTGNSASCNTGTINDNIEFDGFTKVLTAIANVQECETYTIRLLVGDVGDGIYDSAVFLEANSFAAGGTASGTAFSPTTSSNVSYEACSDGYFEIEVGGDITTPRTVDFFISPNSTATEGVDYANLPTSVTALPGQSTVIIPVDVFDDGILEGQETIILELLNSCSCTNGIIELIIQDSPPMDVAVPEVEVCPDEPATLSASVSGGLPNFTYAWSNNAGNSASVTVTPDQTTLYTVTVTDACGLTSTAETQVTVSGASEAVLSGQAQFCEAPFTAELEVNFQGQGPWIFAYSLNGVPQPDIIATENPTIIEVSDPGVYQAEYVAPQAYPTCVGVASGSAFVELVTINAQATATPVSCTGAGDGAVSASTNGGSPPYFFSWTNATTNQPLPGVSNTLTGLPPGVYEVEVTDGSGCTETVQAEVTEPSPLAASVAGTEGVNCLNPNGGSIDLSVSGGTPGYSYVWSNGASAQDPQNLPAGAYAVTVIDNVGCIAVAAAVVEENFDLPTAVVNTPDTITCTDLEVTLDGTGSSTGPDLTATWSGPGLSGNPGLTATAEQAGIYQLSVSNEVNGCVAEATVIVEADNDPPDIELQESFITCADPQAVIGTLGSAEGPQLVYNWAGPGLVSGGNTLSPTVDVPGTYSVTVTDNLTGCVAEATVPVTENTTPPLVDAGLGSELTCEDPEVILSASADGNTGDFVYAWSTPDGNIADGGNTLSPTVNAGGLYELLVTDTLNGCTATDTVSVEKDDNLPVAIITGPQQLDCNNASLQFDAQSSNLGPDGIYEWSTPNGNISSGANTLTPTIDAPGAYQLIISAPSISCYDTATVTVEVDTVAPEVELPNPGILNCDVDTLNLQATAITNSGNQDLAWTGPGGALSEGADPLSQTVTEPGGYTLTVTDPANGCATSVAVAIQQDIEAPEAVIAVPAIIDCGTNTVLLDGSGSSSGANFAYTWTAPDSTVLAATGNQLPAVATPGVYQLQVDNTANGCQSTVATEVLIDTLLPEVGIAPPITLTCTDTLAALSATASANTSNLEYAWSTPDGNLLSGATTAELLTDTPGAYTLLVTNADNECEQSASVTVNQDIEAPIVDAGPGTTLDCQQTDYTLQATASGNASLTHDWSTDGGQIVSGGTTLSPVVDAPGTYTLLTTNQGNGCTASSTVDIDENVDLPAITITADTQIDCSTPTATLDASSSDSGPGLAYEWSSTDGSFSDSTGSAVITALQAGTYTLSITNTVNQCVSTETVTVIENTAVPLADAGADGILNCDVASVSIGGSSTSQSASMAYSWTLDGVPLPGADSPTLEAQVPGVYQLAVLNTENQCEDVDETTIAIDTLAPAATAAVSDTLTCTQTSLQIDGAGSSQGASMSYAWGTTNGQLDSGADGLSPTVSSGGLYTLIVTDNSNGCQNETAVWVQQDTLSPVAEAGAPVRLTCTDTQLPLDATASSQGGFTYVWSGPGLVNGANALTPTVDQPGTYSLAVTNTQNGCVSNDAVQVSQDITPPQASIAAPDVLNCTLTAQDLDAAASSQGSLYEYNWSTPDGTISAGQQTLSPTISAPGTYELLVQNTDNGCTQTASITVQQDITPPVVTAAPPDTLTCNTTSIQIDGSGSSSGANFAYDWTTGDGNLVSGSNAPIPTVNSGGTYVLTLTNTQNNCTSSLEVAVVQDTVAPVAEAGPAQELNCDNPTVALSGAGSSNGGYSYAWTGPGLVSGSTGLEPVVNISGDYTLVVTDDFNGCVSLDEVTITQDTLSPTVLIGAPAILNCSLTEQQLQAGNSSQGGAFNYTWTTSNGNIANGNNTLAPLINAPGDYQLLIENTDNGCSASASVAVEQDTVAPVIAAQPPDTLTCAVTAIAIDASSSSTGPAFVYEWSTADGQITAGADTPVPTVSSGGTYTLLLTNTVNFCERLLEVPVEQDTVAPVAEAGSPQQLDCDHPTLTLSGAGSSSGDVSYEWEGPGLLQETATLTPAVNLPGTYTLIVTDNFNQCTATDEVAITQDVGLPSVLFTAPELLTCDVDTVTLDASSSTQGNDFGFSWSTQDGQFTGATDSLSLTIAQPGTYTLTIENLLTGCTNTNQVEVQQDITPPVADAGPGFLLECWENTGSLDGTGSNQGSNFTYSWSTDDGSIQAGSQTATPTIIAPGAYTLIVTNTKNGCTAQDEVVVTQPLPEASFNLVQPLCYGDPGTIRFPEVSGGTPPYTFSIDGGDSYQASSLFAQVEPGDYQLIVRDENGCTFEAQGAIVQPDSLIALIRPSEATIEFGESYTINTQFSLPDTEIARATWSPTASLDCEDCLRPNASPLRSTDYLVNVVSANGCTDQATFRLFVDRSRPIYVPNAFSPNGDGTNDLFYIYARHGIVENIKAFQVFNRWGESVFEGYNLDPNNPQHGWDGKFRGEFMNPAVFGWYAEIEFIDGTVEIFKGDVQLSR